MQRFTQKALRELVRSGVAVDVTHARERDEIPENYRQIGYSCGVYGCNGMLLQGCETNKLYAVTSCTSAIYVF